MRKHAKVITFIPVIIALLLVFGVFTLVGSAKQFTQASGKLLTNSIDLVPNSFIPISFKACSPLPVESPFSVEISALHMITTTNAINQGLTEDQYLEWYNQAFPTLVSALKDSGAGWTRVVIRWFDIEPNEPAQGGEPVYDQGFLKWYDDRISQISQAGVKIIAVINSPPGWANGPDTNVCPAITTDHIVEYQQFISFLVSRYSQPPYNIKTWEIFNEADNTTPERAESHACFGYKDATVNGPHIYSQVLTASNTTIKTVDPNATVLMSGIAYENWTEYIPPGPFYRYFPDEVMSSTLGTPAFDAFNLHYFPDFHLEWERWNPPANQPTCGNPEDGVGTPYAAGGIDVIAKRNYFVNRMNTCDNVTKPLWLTEMGEHGVITDTGSLENQAYYVLKGYSRGLAAGIKNITWFTLAEPLNYYYQSLLDLNLSPKPAYYAFKTMISQLTNYQYDRTLLSTPTGEAYVFKNSCNDEKIVAWGNDILLTVIPAKALQVTDYLGNVNPITDGGSGDEDGTQNGSIQVKLSLNPMTDSKIILAPVPIPVFIHVISR